MAQPTFKLGIVYRLNTLASGTGFYSLEAELPDPNKVIIKCSSKYISASNKEWYLDTSIMPDDLSHLTFVSHEQVNEDLVVTLKNLN